MANKHGAVSSKTEVPRRTLITALGDDSKLFNTQSLKKQTDTFHEIEFDV
jgi:hypothetical protein